MAGKFELYKSAGKFRFRLKAGNGQTILTGQGYSSKKGAENGIASIKKNARKDANYERKTAKNGKPYFVLKAANKEVIGTSQMYAGSSGRSNGINCVKKIASGAKVDDQS